MDTVHGSAGSPIASFRPPTVGQRAIRVILFGLVVPLLLPLGWKSGSVYSITVAAGYALLWPAILIAAVTFGLMLGPATVLMRHFKSATVRGTASGSVAGGVAGTVAALSVCFLLSYPVTGGPASASSEMLAWAGKLLPSAFALGLVSGAVAMGIAVRWVGAIVLLAYIALFWSFKLYERDFRLGHVPPGMKVTSVVYAKEESWGIPFFALPGDNETGVIIYELPVPTANEIGKIGIEYFSKLPQEASARAHWQGRYEGWRETPVSGKYWVSDPASGKSSSGPRIDNYLNRYGFGIEIDSDVKRLIDHAIGKPGSYFAYGRFGVLIVIPAERRAVYVYAG